MLVALLNATFNLLVIATVVDVVEYMVILDTVDPMDSVDPDTVTEMIVL